MSVITIKNPKYVNVVFKNEKEYADKLSLSLKNPDSYWDEVAKTVTWIKPYKTISNANFDKDTAKIEWFLEGTLNIAYNCINAHLPKYAHKTALIFVNNNLTQTTKITYQQLHLNVNKYSNMLVNAGIKVGDVVTIYMPTSLEAIYAMLACANIGAVHSVVFTGFAATSLAERINDAKSKFLLTTSQATRGNRVVNLKEIVDETIKLTPQLTKVIINNVSNASLASNPIYFDMQLLVNNSSDNFEPVEMKSEDPLFILYTSGTTAKPKGLLHTTGGYAVYSKNTFKVNFNYSIDEIYFCTADIGWVTGHTYTVYGPLLNAATVVIYEGLPNYPDAGSYWKICSELKVNIFYTSPTAIRSLMSYDIEKYTKMYDLSNLKILGTVGEPINLEAWKWFFTHIGGTNCPIVDTWWQTETGGHIISSIPYINPLKPTKAGRTFFGINAVILDDNQTILPANSLGALCLTNSWPGIARSIINNHALYLKTYFTAYPGYYFSGDEAIIDTEGDIRIVGRKDDVIKVSGHRLSSANLEDTINMHPDIVESAAVGADDALKGSAIVIFCTLSKASANKDKIKIAAEVNALLKEKIGTIASSKSIIITPDLPKTRSGKIMRRILRKISNQEYSNFGDTSTLLNPEIIEVIVEIAKAYKKL